MAMRILLAVNTRARRGRRARDAALGHLRAAGHEVFVGQTRSPADLDRVIRASARRVDAVAIGGGDGTLISAIGALRDTGLPLAILPLGTINELARTLEIPPDLQTACALVTSGRVRRIDVGCVNGTWFFNEASIGLSTHVAREQTGEVKSRWGLLAIPVATLRAWRYMRPYHLELEAEDGTRHAFRTMQMTIANSYRFGGVVENPEARIDDATLDCYSIELNHWWDPLEILLAVARRRFPAARGVCTLRGSRFVVRSRRPHRVYADGEPATRTPAEFVVVPKAIAIYVPA